MAQAQRDAAVEQIYRDKDGKLPDFTRFDRRPPPWRRWAIGGGLVTLALLTVAAWAGFLIFKPYTASSGGNVTVRIEASETAMAGDEVAYRIRIANDDRVPLANTALELAIPEHLVLASADPAPDDARAVRWTIGTIPARGERTVELRGRLYGAPDTEVRLTATAIYRPANFNADFQTIASATTRLGQSPLALTITGPERAIAGEPVTYAIAYAHAGTIALPTSAITVELPRSFVMSNAQPVRPKREDLRWPIGEVAAGVKGTIAIDGSFGTDAKGAQAVRARALVEVGGDRRIMIAESTATTEVLGGDVVVLTTVNDQTGRLEARPGDALRFRIAVRNDGQAELRGLTVRAVFEATSVDGKSILDFNRIEDPANGTAVGEPIGTDRRRGTITWTSAQVADLASVPAGEQRMATFTLPLRIADGFTYPAGSRVTLTASVEVAATGTLEQVRRVSGAPVEIRIP